MAEKTQFDKIEEKIDAMNIYYARTITAVNNYIDKTDMLTEKINDIWKVLCEEKILDNSIELNIRKESKEDE